MPTNNAAFSGPTRLHDNTDLLDLVNEHKAHVARRVYVDPELYQIEQERLFRRAWLFLAHDTELPNKGDYVTRNLAGESVVLVRSDDGVVRGFLNSCRHRGMKLCRADHGTIPFFRCSYHGWTYSLTGALRAVFAKDLYQDANLRKDELGLIPITRLDSYKGLIFGSWSTEVPTLPDYLGKMRFYLDLFLGRTTVAPRLWAPRKSGMSRPIGSSPPITLPVTTFISTAPMGRWWNWVWCHPIPCPYPTGI